MPTRLRRFTGFLAVALVLVACSGPTTTPPPSTPPSTTGGRAGATPAVAPGALHVEMDGFAGGLGFTLPDDLGGKPLVLNVWASWCTPCRTEMPAFQTVYLKVRDRMGFLGLDMTDQEGAARRLVAETGVTYPLAADPRGQAAAKLGVTGLPATLFIGADGQLRGRRAGELNAGQLRDAIRRYLKVTVP
jgi:cytochrome c biogenesis protein CcmG/thiol:disulfide interchange protein DsbE